MIPLKIACWFSKKIVRLTWSHFIKITTKRWEESAIFCFFLEFKNLVNADGRVHLQISMTMKVIIEDINDHDPFFVNLPNTIYISESTQLITPVYTVTADDYDDNQNKKVYYTVQTVGH